MPGYVIHIATAKKYIEKHKYEIKDEQEFIRGSIAPDMNEKLDGPSEDKSKTHYGKWGKYEVISHIDEFLKDPKVDISNDFWKGYFLHLITDYYFYHKSFKQEHRTIIENNDRFYYDYDCLNRELIEKYKIDIIENIRPYMDFYDGKPKYLKINKIESFIEEISNMNIQEKIKNIKEKGMEGLQ